MSEQMSVSWDPRSRLATFMGSGGFTQVQMPRNDAWAIAYGLGVEFYVSEPGTTLRPEAGVS